MVYDNLERQRRFGTPNAIERIMRLRISVESVGAKARISIAGELLAEGIGELKRTAPPTGESLELDLSDLTFADSDGVEALRGLIDDGATAIGASPFIKKLLAI